MTGTDVAQELLDFLADTETNQSAAIVTTPEPKPQPRPETSRRLIAEVIEAGQDFEFYPTTDEIIRAMIRDIGAKDYPHESVLDIGAGNGKVLLALRNAKLGYHCDRGFRDLYAIEKSQRLCQKLPNDILIVGTEFAEQSLISKQVDAVFCNPPYSEFETWAEKIIRQAAAKVVYLVIPDRWERSTKIADALTFREAKAHNVGCFDFEDAEDRQARAKVHLLRIELHVERYQSESNDAFERFFKEQFADLIGKFGEDTGPATERKRPFHELVVGPQYPEALVNIYNAELAHIERNYQLVSELDADLLREFDISPLRIMGCLRLRLNGLRNDYWNELFSHLNAITDRLTHKSRNQLLETLRKHVQVDFTLSNILAVIIWVIKNANQFIESQLIETYETMIAKCNVILYKSNKKTFEDNGWRYNRDEDKNSHYALDYRIVTHRVGGINIGYGRTELDENAATFLGDLCTLARNLGFNCRTVHQCLDYHGRQEWIPGERVEFYYADTEGQRRLLYDVRAFKNRNLHLRLNKQFILALNVEHGRLKGWLRSPAEAVAELGEVEAADYFRANMQLQSGDPTLMLTQ